MILIDDIAVVNPRVRNAKIHRVITESIEDVGLKRPITVRRLNSGSGEKPYALICGQGRLESYKMLGQTEIAALVADVDEETGHVMSIVENVARRSPRAGEALEQVRSLRSRGYSDAEIGIKLGYEKTWVSNVVTLLERGERRLLIAAESGYIPLNLAVSISRSSDSEVQQLLLDAYESGEIKGRKVLAVRKILEQRMRNGKQGRISFRSGSNRRPMSPEDLAKLYQRDTAKHQLIQKKAEHTQGALLLTQQIFKELFSSDEFRELLRREKLTDVPTPLVDLARQEGFLP
ncbi:plasmid partitioning protein RepB C-terminal domain-containing protein [Polaromonas sp. CF318]|uniref:plasmid partitioning protein RepB C-terminal domain-containing protein n=1 Tax=Polaromonas sp. CF318 TaxID=1144318 RepID=UPI001EE654C3|nr:plasmid partitioning protein RepB C-terminal domain-containing protein [Polaromonas sp. CF318]